MISVEKSLDLLPKRTAELVQVVGFTVAMDLVRYYGGTHLNIPKKARADHPMSELIGIEAWGKLCHYYGGTMLEIDLCAKVINHQKQQLILDGVNNGKTNAQLAREFHTTERQIRRIKQLKYLKEAEPVNVDLFDLLRVGQQSSDVFI